MKQTSRQPVIVHELIVHERPWRSDYEESHPCSRVRRDGDLGCVRPVWRPWLSLLRCCARLWLLLRRGAGLRLLCLASGVVRKQHRTRRPRPARRRRQRHGRRLAALKAIAQPDTSGLKAGTRLFSAGFPRLYQRPLSVRRALGIRAGTSVTGAEEELRIGLDDRRRNDLGHCGRGRRRGLSRLGGDSRFRLVRREGERLGGQQAGRKTDRDAANEDCPTQRRTSSDDGNICVRSVHGSLHIVGYEALVRPAVILVCDSRHSENRRAARDRDSASAYSRGRCNGRRLADQPGVTPLALNTATASGVLRKSMNALAAAASLVSAAIAAANTRSCCNSPGNAPANSTPGAISALVRKMPTSASPRATALAISPGVGCTLVLAFIASAMPRRSNTPIT